MKTIIKTIICVTLIFNAFTSFAQVNVTTENMTYSNGNSISNCGTIDLGTNQNTTISFWINLSKDSNQVVGDGDLYVYTKYNVNDASENQVYWKHILSSYWTNNNTQYSEYTDPAITLQSQMFNTTGGVLFVRYVSSSNTKYYSCNFNIIKDETPTFTISPSSTNVTCDLASPKTFTVTNVYNSPGNLSYQWQIGNGWLYNGNAVSNFTTSTNTVTLVPTSFPPSNVQVTPVLDNHTYSQLTSIINLSDFNPSYSISGNNSICEPSSSGVYSIANLPSGLTITWSSSNTAIGTVSGTGNSITVNKVSNGTFNINARVTNSCGQFVDLSKSIRIGGLPNFTINAVDTGGSYDLFVQNVPITENQGITSVTWTKISGNGIAGGNGLIGYADGSPTSTWTVTVRITATNECGSTSITRTYRGGGYGGDPCRKISITKGKKKKNQFIARAPACRIGNSTIKAPQKIINIKVYNISGNFIKEFKTNSFDLSNNKKGIYIVNITTTNDVISTKVLVE